MAESCGQLLSGLNAGPGAQKVYGFDRSTTDSYHAKIRRSYKTCAVIETATQHFLVAAGKGVHPTLRYRDPYGNIFSETTNSFGRSETTSLFTTTPSTSTSTQSTTPDTSQSEPDSPSTRSASEGASDSDSEEKEEEAVSHLQRLQGLAGSWRRHNKRPRLGREYREGGAGHQEEDDVPEAAAMQVYVHGINVTGLQSALEKSSLWHRIGLNNNLEVGMLLVLLAVQSMSASFCVTCHNLWNWQQLALLSMCVIVVCKDSVYNALLHHGIATGLLEAHLLHVWLSCLSIANYLLTVLLN